MLFYNKQGGILEIREPKILIYDIEVTPILGYTYGLWKTNVIKVEKEPYLMSFAYKWYDKKRTKCLTLADMDTYKVDPENDYLLVKELWKLLDEADVVITHNGNRFDNKVANAFFIRHKLNPPSPYKQLDTLQIAKSTARFSSNSLNNLGELLGIGKKTNETHGSLWRKCIDGDLDAWKKMAKYNIQDVDLSCKLYDILRPYAKTHVNLARLANKPDACPYCLEEGSLIRQGYRTTQRGKFQKYSCKKCGAWCSSATAEKDGDIKPRYTTVR